MFLSAPVPLIAGTLGNLNEFSGLLRSISCSRTVYLAFLLCAFEGEHMLFHGSPRKVTQHVSQNMWSVGLEIISLPFIQIKDIWPLLNAMMIFN